MSQSFLTYDTVAESFQSSHELPKADTRKVDYRALEYLHTIDENLLCPICRSALIDPVTTRCDHVFCRECFEIAYTASATCPIDREPLSSATDILRAHRLILNQLDALEVRCPESHNGCQKVLARSMVQNHLERYCDYAEVPCAKPTCDEKIARHLYQSGCLHWNEGCPDCGEMVMKKDIVVHREDKCKERKKFCDKCSVEIVKCQENRHRSECPQELASCPWMKYGCEISTKRKDLSDHQAFCQYRIVGPVMETMERQMSALQAEITELNERDKTKDRRIKLLENERAMAMAHPSSSYSYGMPDMSMLDAPSSMMESAPYDSRDQYLLSLFESQETKVEQLSTGLSELEARSTMLLLNETSSIKEQLLEMRNAQGVLGMHVRWLMNFRLQERRPGTVTGTSSAAAGTESHVGPARPGVQPTRRLSDTMRENITKL